MYTLLQKEEASMFIANDNKVLYKHSRGGAGEIHEGHIDNQILKEVKKSHMATYT